MCVESGRGYEVCYCVAGKVKDTCVSGCGCHIVCECF